MLLSLYKRPPVCVKRPPVCVILLITIILMVVFTYKTGLAMCLYSTLYQCVITFFHLPNFREVITMF